MTITHRTRGGEKYAVTPGSVWGIGEQHLVACVDTEQGGALELLEICRQTPAVVYADPPWGAAQYGMFRSRAGLRGTMRDNKLGFRALMARIAELFSAARAGLLEMDYVSLPAVLTQMREHGLYPAEQWNLRSNFAGVADSALLVLASDVSRVPLELPQLDGRTDSPPTVRLALTALTEPGETVLDPCCGLGITAESAVLEGRTFVGCELNPYRVSVTIERIRALTDAPVTRLR